MGNHSDMFSRDVSVAPAVVHVHVYSSTHFKNSDKGNFVTNRLLARSDIYRKQFVLVILF